MHSVLLPVGLIPAVPDFLLRKIQMIINIIYFYNIPGMTVFDSLLWIITADSNDTPYSQRVQQYFHCLGNALTDTHALPQRSNDLMGIGFFQLIITYIFTDKIMHMFFFFKI